MKSSAQQHLAWEINTQMSHQEHFFLEHMLAVFTSLKLVVNDWNVFFMFFCARAGTFLYLIFVIDAAEKICYFESCEMYVL